MRSFALAALAISAVSAFAATEVGVFSDARLLDSTWNIVSGSVWTTTSNIWTSRGANFHETSLITPEFLANKKVFITGKLAGIDFTAAEVDAVANWVRAGGTLVVTAECGCYSTQGIYTHLTLPYQIVINGTSTNGQGTVLAASPITNGLTTVSIEKNGQVWPPAEATKLIADYQGKTASLIMEKTPFTGLGRVFVISDCDMFTDNSLAIYPENVTLMQNIATWAMTSNARIDGKVTVQNFSGSLAGMPLTLVCFDGDVQTDTKTVGLAADGSYGVDLDQPGTCNIVAKLPRWLSVRVNDVVVSSTRLDWNFAINGDVTNDNAIDLFDLNAELIHFGEIGQLAADLDGDGLVNLFDLNLVLVHFGSVGQ